MSQSQHPQTGSFEVLVQSPSLVTTGLLVCFTVFPIIATVSIIVRVHCQHKNSQSLKADDWMIALALVRSMCLSRKCRLASLIFTSFSWCLGLKRSMYLLPPRKEVLIQRHCLQLKEGGQIFWQEASIFLSSEKSANGNRQFIWVGGLILIICLTAIKISILLFYHRIFAIIRPFRLSVYFAITVLIGWCISIFVVSIPPLPLNISLPLILKTHDRGAVPYTRLRSCIWLMEAAGGETKI